MTIAIIIWSLDLVLIVGMWFVIKGRRVRRMERKQAELAWMRTVPIYRAWRLLDKYARTR